jgi:hypothetical protein
VRHVNDLPVCSPVRTTSFDNPLVLTGAAIADRQSVRARRFLPQS